MPSRRDRRAVAAATTCVLLLTLAVRASASTRAPIRTSTKKEHMRALEVRVWKGKIPHLVAGNYAIAYTDLGSDLKLLPNMGDLDQWFY